MLIMHAFTSIVTNVTIQVFAINSLLAVTCLHLINSALDKQIYFRYNLLCLRLTMHRPSVTILTTNYSQLIVQAFNKKKLKSRVRHVQFVQALNEF